MKLGIMQGRLVPPVNAKIQAFPKDQWADEFPRAEAAGLSCIEWIYETYGADVNPIASDDGLRNLKDLAARHRVGVHSVCADYFMEFPLVRATREQRADRIGHLAWLLERCGKAGIARAVIPFVDASAIRSREDEAEAAACLNEAVPAAERCGVELHLETSLGPAEFASFLNRMPSRSIKVNYDSGNSASLGYRPTDELAAYGARVGSVHIKDRVRGGGTVPLGQGDADFDALFEGLRKIHYGGDFILQVARGEPGDEVNWAVHNRRDFESRAGSFASNLMVS